MRNKNIFSQLYFGNPANERISRTPEYIKAGKETSKAFDDFRNNLSNEKQELLDKLYNLIMIENFEECFCNYAEGFKVGLLMGIEVAGGCE
ncbi:MAG: hypothetical protein FWC80_03600 [Firmicutes bacterium]|nr:hypothetical protein [Bacillota bacterium]